jgi:drug/metabolite transporter (DMT)-like permease
VTACAATLAHLALETTVWPASRIEWLAIAGLGLGPVGAAFYFWDYGVKHGDIRVLGAAAYTAPLLSTLSLVAFGLSQATPSLWVACVFITAGAVLAAKDMLFAQWR